MDRLRLGLRWPIIATVICVVLLAWTGVAYWAASHTLEAKCRHFIALMDECYFTAGCTYNMDDARTYTFCVEQLRRNKDELRH